MTWAYSSNSISMYFGLQHLQKAGAGQWGYRWDSARGGDGDDHDGGDDHDHGDQGISRTLAILLEGEFSLLVVVLVLSTSPVLYTL